MTSILFNADYRAISIPKYYDHIISDPPYEAENIDLPLPGGNTIFFCKPENQFFKPDEYLFWVKTPSTKNYSKNCGRFVEMILVKRNCYTFHQLHWSQMTGVFDDRLIMPPVHPHEKPLALIERLIRIYTNEGDTVFDPFMGSGTTGVACANLKREFVGCEIVPEYYEIAERRIHEAESRL